MFEGYYIIYLSTLRVASHLQGLGLLPTSALTRPLESRLRLPEVAAAAAAAAAAAIPHQSSGTPLRRQSRRGLHTHPVKRRSPLSATSAASCAHCPSTGASAIEGSGLGAHRTTGEVRAYLLLCLALLPSTEASAIEVMLTMGRWY